MRTFFPVVIHLYGFKSFIHPPSDLFGRKSQVFRTEGDIVLNYGRYQLGVLVGLGVGAAVGAGVGSGVGAAVGS